MQDLILRISAWIADKRGCGWFGRSIGTGFNPPATRIGWAITATFLAAILLTFALPAAIAWPARIILVTLLFGINLWTALPPD